MFYINKKFVFKIFNLLIDIIKYDTKILMNEKPGKNMCQSYTSSTL